MSEISAIIEDLVPVLEEILDREDMDYDDCAAMENFALCGSSWCNECGCIVDKLARLRALAHPMPEGEVR